MLVLTVMVHMLMCAPMGSVPPHPSQVAALRWRSNGLLLTGLCAAVSPTGPVLPHRQPAVLLGRLAGVLLSRASPGSRKRLPVAAAFFFLLRKRKVIPAGPRQGWAPAPSPLHAMGPPLSWPCPPGLQRRGKEEDKQKCRSNRPLRARGRRA